MYYIYGQSGPSLLIESTDSMIGDHPLVTDLKWTVALSVLGQRRLEVWLDHMVAQCSDLVLGVTQ